MSRVVFMNEVAAHLERQGYLGPHLVSAEVVLDAIKAYYTQGLAPEEAARELVLQHKRGLVKKQ